METITVNIAPNGAITIDAEGFTGTSCTEATQRLELVLGGATRKKKDYKPEYSLPAQTGITAKSRL